MGEVIRLDRKHAEEAERHYYCLKCDSEQFKLLATGVVTCSHCGSWMRNLVVDESTPH